MRVTMRTEMSLLLLAVFTTSLIGFSSEVVAQGSPPYVKFCAYWKSRYVDSGKGENYFTSSQYLYRKGDYSRGIVEWEHGSNNWIPIWNGWFDENGCSPYLAGVSNSKYRVIQGTAVKRDNRTIYVNPANDQGSDNSNWDTLINGTYYPTLKWYTSGYQMGTLQAGNYYDFKIQPNTQNPWFNLMPLLGRIMRDPGRFAFTDGSSVRIRVDSGQNGTQYCHNDVYGPIAKTYYIRSTRNVCLHGFAGAYYPNRPDATNWKFTVGHELGHRFAALHNGLTNEGSYSDFPANSASNAPDCNCAHVTGTFANSVHCLTSRHNSGIIQGEGFAHFFATALWNTRVRTGGVFTYYKEAKVWNSGQFTDTDPPVGHAAYVVSPWNTSANPYDRWRNRRCEDSSNPNTGVQLDWLKFFWELWTESNTNTRFSILQMNQVWQGKQSAALRTWTNLISLATWPHSADRRELFREKGELAGVRD